MAFYPPKGLIISLVTPLDEKGQVDWPSFERLIEKTLPFADGFLIGDYVIGEGFSLPASTRRELLQGAMEALAGRRPVFLCPTAETEEETLWNVEAISAAVSQKPTPSPLFWVDMPLWYHSNRKLPQLYEEWKKRTPIPILLYNQPWLISRLGKTLKRKNIRTALLKRLSENEQIVGMIYVGDLKRAIEYQRAVRLRRDFLFYDGDERNFLNQPSSSGVVSAGANLLPAQWREIVVASLNLREDPAHNLLVFRQSQKLRELSQILREGPVLKLKQALKRVGIIAHAKALLEDPSAAPGRDSPLENFLKENFALQSPSQNDMERS